jgi:hypothetical protein
MSPAASGWGDARAPGPVAGGRPVLHASTRPGRAGTVLPVGRPTTLDAPRRGRHPSDLPACSGHRLHLSRSRHRHRRCGSCGYPASPLVRAVMAMLTTGGCAVTPGGRHVDGGFLSTSLSPEWECLPPGHLLLSTPGPHLAHSRPSTGRTGAYTGLSTGVDAFPPCSGPVIHSGGETLWTSTSR